MILPRAKRLKTVFLLVVFILSIPAISPAAGLDDLFGKKELNEEDRQEAIERIESIQDKLKLLQDKLRALERRKAAKEAATRAERIGSNFSEAPVHVNWLPLDETVANPGEYGLYTYVLFNGSQEDLSSIASLEDFILTIETLQANNIPPGLANKFLIPVEKPQSIIKLGRQPYDFKLNQSYLARFGISSDLPAGPILVSSHEFIDPYDTGEIPGILTVAPGKQPPEKAAKLAGVWHKQEKEPVLNGKDSVSDLFWQLIDGIGTVNVSRNGQKITISMPQE